MRERHVKIRSVEKNPHTGKTDYSKLVVQSDSPLWTGDLHQRLIVGVTEVETYGKEKERYFGTGAKTAKMMREQRLARQVAVITQQA